MVSTALIAIFFVLSGDFGEFELKVLATTFTISAASICSMSCAAFIEKRKKREFGLAGMTCAAIAALMLISGMWFEISGEVYWKSAITFIVLAVALAHAFLLILPDLDFNHRWTQLASPISIGILAIQIIVAVWNEIDSEGYFKLLAVVSIIVVLLTLVVPILMKMRKGVDEAIETLLLSKHEDGTYIDNQGNMYEVEKINTEQEDLGNT
ncbi:uncharacterized protein METZ01_LOCUS316515 [marine metagenome]|uniref:7TM-DISM receptor extracellular domain-containing protein n=1 Tax=marine metagenome TaxID=408172 RepID=A0A382NVR3_9ZZZZ